MKKQLKTVISKEFKGLWGSDFSADGIPVIKTNNMTYEGRIDFSDICIRNISYAQAKDNFLKKGDLLIEKSGGTKTHSVGYVNIFEGEDDKYVCNSFILPLRPNIEIVVPKYLFWQLHGMYKAGRFSDCYNKTTGIQNLQKKTYFSKDIIVPTISEQNRIVEYLDKIQLAIDKKKKQLVNLDELSTSRFLEMFGDPVINEKGWNLKTLPELGEFGRGVSKHRPRNAPELLGGKYPLIQTGDVANASLYISHYEATYSEKGYIQSKMWKAGTLCITIAANIAKTAILTFDSCFPDSVVGFTPNEATNSLFINYWFLFFQKILEEQAPGVAQKNINLQVLSKLKIIAPEKRLQDDFANYVNKIELAKSKIQKQLIELQELLDSKLDEYFL